MGDILTALFVAWLAWCAGLWVVMLIAPYFCYRNVQGVFTNGITVFNTHMLGQYPDDEADAVMAHEYGHIYQFHTIKTVLRLCFFAWFDDRYVEQQELEADDYALRRGHGRALARAIRRGAVTEFDLKRAARLELIALP